MAENHLVKVDQFSSADFQKIAELHCSALPGSFLGTLGVPVLRLVYEGIHFTNSNGSFIIAAAQDGEIVGFIAGASSLKGVFVWLLKKRFFQLTAALFPSILSPSSLRRIFEISCYAVLGGKRVEMISTNEAVPDFELLSLCVSTNCQGGGVGRFLYETFVEHVRQMQIREFKIVVGDILAGAQEFYKRMGARHCGNITLHKGEESKLYIHKFNEITD